MANDPIAVLESRIIDLEQKVFGKSDSTSEIPLSITDNLLESHKIVLSAVSGREKVAAVVKRLDQLETTLDPMYEDSVVDSTAKLAFILSMEQELEDATRELVRVNELSSYLESEKLRNIPHLMKQLGKLTITMIEQKEKCDLVDEKIDDLITKYSEVNNGITAVFATLNSKVKELEIKARPMDSIE